MWCVSSSDNGSFFVSQWKRCTSFSFRTLGSTEAGRYTNHACIGLDLGKFEFWTTPLLESPMGHAGWRNAENYNLKKVISQRSISALYGGVPKFYLKTFSYIFVKSERRKTTIPNFSNTLCSFLYYFPQNYFFRLTGRAKHNIAYRGLYIQCLCPQSRKTLGNAFCICSARKGSRDEEEGYWAYKYSGKLFYRQHGERMLSLSTGRLLRLAVTAQNF